MDISVFTQNLQTEDRSWDLTPPDGGFEIGGTLDVSAFTQGTHYPNGFLPSGTVLGKISSSNKFGPYNNAGSGGLDTAACVLKASVRIVRSDGSKPAFVGFAGLVHGAVDTAKLPFQSGTGAIDTAGKADLKLIYFA